ncbi:hypothetical protein SLS53_000990 [Cytospora paraplurivora]|uniref:Uncharacterized protein n=1 Tax=Cytospora paraplurivora TaxID=2898453 RepID=A0AAN9UJ78_9PEZI
MADQAVNVQATEPEVAKPVEDVQVEDAPAVEAKAEEAKTEQPDEAVKENGEAQTEKAEEKESNILKTKARLDPENNNSKYDPSVLPVTDDPQQIRVQVEFYFGDSNLPEDEYMWKLSGGFENNPVPLKKITSFGRMRRFQPYEAVVKALRESQFLVVAGEEGKETIARKVPYKSQKRGDKLPNTVYAKGFGDEKASTQFDLENFFRQYGPVTAIRLRRTPELLFKGSVFVEFDNEEHAKAFLALDPQPKWEGHDLKIMSKQAYVEEKKKLIEEGKMQPGASKPPRTFWEGERLGFRGGRGRGGNNNNFKGDRDDWRARKEHDRRGGGRGGRGGRGRGRGGRGGGDRRDRDRDSNNKRSRDDDGAAAEERPAKKVDAKAEASAEAAA